VLKRTFLVFIRTLLVLKRTFLVFNPYIFGFYPYTFGVKAYINEKMYFLSPYIPCTIKTGLCGEFDRVGGLKMQPPANQQSNNSVTKSNVLIEANYKLTVIEQKIILYLVSQIDKDDDDFKMYSLPVQHFYELLGYQGSPKYSEMREITKNLMRKVLEIKEGKKLKQMSWISYVEYDENSGRVSLSFDPRLKPYLLQLKRDFTTYHLKNVMALKSSYSIRIYEILKRWQYRNEIEININHLREMVGATDKYLEYHNFKKRVLTPAEKEIAEKTDILFSYKEVKKGRKVEAIRFVIRGRQGEQGMLGISQDQNSSDTLYAQFLSHLEKHYQFVTEKGFTRIALLAQKVFSENWFNELVKMTENILRREGIREPIAFLTYMLNEKVKLIEKGMDHNNVNLEKIRKVVRHEQLPDWFEEYQQQFLQDIWKNTITDNDEDPELKLKNLEERLKKYRD
jgi:plasmid replication initiation protein